jgi:malate/lactate dehydrogenase
VTVVDPTLSGDAGRLADVESIFVECDFDPERLLNGEIKVLRVDIRRPTLRAVQTADSRWTIERLWPPEWYSSEFIPAVQQRGAAIIKARGASSAASAASAAIDHVRDWMLGSAKGRWVSMGVASDGSYGIDAGVVYSYPVTCNAGSYSIVENLSVNDDCRRRMTASHEELLKERDGVAELL